MKKKHETQILIMQKWLFNAVAQVSELMAKALCLLYFQTETESRHMKAISKGFKPDQVCGSLIGQTRYHLYELSFRPALSEPCNRFPGGNS